MPIFEIEKDGEVFEIEAPDQQSAISAFSRYSTQQTSSSAPSNLPTPDNFNPAANPVNSYDDSYIAQGLSGVNEGLAGLGGLPVDLAAGALNLGAKGINKILGTDIQPIQEPIGGSQSIKNVMGKAISPRTQEPRKQFVRRVGQEVGASVIPMGGIVSKAARPVQSAITQGATIIGSGVGGATAQQIAPDNPYAEMVGQIFGGGAGFGAVAGARRIITPSGTVASPSRIEAVKTLKDEGVNLTAGQKTGSKKLGYLESELGGRQLEDFAGEQADQFTQAALKRIGVRANRATPDVIDGAFKSIGSEFDDLAANNFIKPDQKLVDDLSSIVTEYKSLSGVGNRAPVVENTISNIFNSIRSGDISGEAYKVWRSRLGKLSNSSRANPELSNALKGMQNSLDDAMERTIQIVNPDDLGAWQGVREKYKNLLAIEKAASRAGEQAVTGIITPANLRSAVATQNKRAYSRGRGGLNKLSRAGVETMTPLANSGTAARLSARSLSVPVGSSGLGGGLGFAFSGGNPLGLAVGSAAGAVAPSMVGKALMTPLGRAYAGNQLLKGKVGLEGAVEAGIPSGIAALSQQQQRKNRQR